MISVNDALKKVLDTCRSFGIEEVGILEANGRILASGVVADRDFPAFDRVTMDGIAVNSLVFRQGVRSFYIGAVQAAGTPQKTLGQENHCIEVMTGAMLPLHADAVIPYEDLVIENGNARVKTDSVKTRQNVHLQGSDCCRGDILIAEGAEITPTVSAILASVGLQRVGVKRLPKIAVCSTGDELVEIDQTPASHQIRQSNVYMLLSALLKEGIRGDKYYLPDSPQQMLAIMESLIRQYDAILLSGAVSKGKYDFLPGVLQHLGVTPIVHGVAQKPGKPFLFGQCQKQTVLFGFPGNPVSTWVCYQIYFRAWLSQCMGQSQRMRKVILGSEVTFKSPLTRHLLVRLKNVRGMATAIPVDTSTSGDMVSLIQGEALISLPPSKERFQKGEEYQAILFS